MGIDIGVQLTAVGKGLLLGASLGLCYDWLRLLRRRRPGPLAALTADIVFCLGSLWLLLALTLTQGGGELRLYLVAAAACGSALYLTLLGALLRPLWSFWLDTAGDFVRLLRLPGEKLLQGIKKLGKKGKRLFYFGKKCYIINFQRGFVRRNSGRGAACLATKKKQRSRKNQLLRAVLLLALLLIGLQLYRLQGQLQEARREQEALAEQVAAQQQANDQLTADLEKADDPDYLQDLARQELGLVSPGERVFYDVGK